MYSSCLCDINLKRFTKKKWKSVANLSFYYLKIQLWGAYATSKLFQAYTLRNPRFNHFWKVDLIPIPIFKKIVAELDQLTPFIFFSIDHSLIRRLLGLSNFLFFFFFFVLVQRRYFGKNTKKNSWRIPTTNSYRGYL